MLELLFGWATNSCKCMQTRLSSAKRYVRGRGGVYKRQHARNKLGGNIQFCSNLKLLPRITAFLLTNQVLLKQNSSPLQCRKIYRNVYIFILEPLSRQHKIFWKIYVEQPDSIFQINTVDTVNFMQLFISVNTKMYRLHYQKFNLFSTTSSGNFINQELSDKIFLIRRILYEYNALTDAEQVQRKKHK